MYFVYFASSFKNKKVYVGSTSKKPAERIEEHNIGTNAWSKSNGPFKLVYYEEYFCKQDALRKETFYKSGFGRQVKSAIINSLNL